MSENIQKDSSFMFLCQLFPKISQFTDNVGLGVGHLGFVKFMGFSGKIQLGIISKFF